MSAIVIPLRDQPRIDVGDAVAMHPAARWASATSPFAHRRLGGRAACGEPGALYLADGRVPLCPDCFRRRR